MVGLQLNDAMNVIMIPATLVISVIASTTVFRNLFVVYDSFAFEGPVGFIPNQIQSGRNQPSSRGHGDASSVTTFSPARTLVIHGLSDPRDDTATPPSVQDMETLP